MELPPPRVPSLPHSSESSTESPDMSTIALQARSAPSFKLPSPRELSWDDRRPQALSVGSRSQPSPSERIELPSIRQAVPEIQHSFREPDHRVENPSYSPTGRLRVVDTPPEYTQSSLKKRRRRSNDEDLKAESRERSTSRPYQSPSPHRQHSTVLSPTNAGRRLSTISSEPWSASAGSSPYVPARALHGPGAPSSFASTGISRSDWRPTLPSLPSLTFDRTSQNAKGVRGTWSEYALESTTRLGAQTYPQVSQSAFAVPPSSYQPPSVEYGYQQPRNQAFSGPSKSHPISHDRTPFSSSQHTGYPSGNFSYGLEMNDMGSDSKQRKRRGNLPKETTDKLRAWFIAHLQHPYPTEDEKQDLMRTTGLQMNQISNWFINARRRQLPTMINNARVESDARSARGGEIIGDFTGGERKKGNSSLGDSDGEGSLYEDEFDGFAGRPAVQAHSKLESL